MKNLFNMPPIQCHMARKVNAVFPSYVRAPGREGSRCSCPTHPRCLAVWKYAIILEGLYRHYLEGTAANPKAAEFAWKVPQLVQRAQRIMAEAG